MRRKIHKCLSFLLAAVLLASLAAVSYTHLMLPTNSRV